ncbi:MAG: hypothetical protein KBD43_14865 [Saprospiraceae bacterium]|nr:hypothetical protein [Saprospiraceae bacterium]
MKYPKLTFAIILSIYFLSFASDYITREKWNIIDSVNLVIHEAGHSIFSFFGEFIHVISGSLFQILVPVVFVIYFAYWRKEYYSASILLFWVGQNIINVARYMSDSIKLELPLLGGDGVIHDWNYLLSSLNILHLTDTLSMMVYNFGFIVIIVAAVLSVYFAWYNYGYESTNKSNAKYNQNVT